MEPIILSSNWKKLQETLKKSEGRKEQEKRPINTLKRPLDSRLSRENSHTAKKLKISTFRAARVGGKMGAYVSARPATEVPEAEHDSKRNGIQPSANGAMTDKFKYGESAVAGKYIALDCEMVGTSEVTPFSIVSHNKDARPGAPPEYSILARVSLVNYGGTTIYDAYVQPPIGVHVTNYRTQWSGITAAHLDPHNATTKPISFDKAQEQVSALLKGRIIVGHALKNDLEVLGLNHPKRDVRDTSRYAKYRETAALVGKNGKPGKSRTPSLKKLASEVLGVDIQMGQGHSSVEDAWTSMLLFKREKKGMEVEVAKLYGKAQGLIKPSISKVDSAQVVSKSLIPITDSEEEVQPDKEETIEVSGDENEDSDELEAISTAKPKAKKRKRKKAKSRTKR